jgi:hypothetical protein
MEIIRRELKRSDCSIELIESELHIIDFIKEIIEREFMMQMRA